MKDRQYNGQKKRTKARYHNGQRRGQTSNSQISRFVKCTCTYVFLYMVRSFLKLIIFSFADIILWKLYWNCQKYKF